MAEAPLHFPLDRWGDVTGEAFQRICIVRSGAAFLVLIQQGERHFDHWLETAEDVALYLDGVSIVWSESNAQ